jgi:hypothetical protein
MQKNHFRFDFFDPEIEILVVFSAFFSLIVAKFKFLIFSLLLCQKQPVHGKIRSKTLFYSIKI